MTQRRERPGKGHGTRQILSIAARLGLGLAVVAVLAPARIVYAETERTIKVDAVDDDAPLDGCTLREAIDLANAGAGVGIHPNQCTVKEVVVGVPFPIQYTLNLPAYVYALTGNAGEDGNVSGDLDIYADVTINGVGPDKTIIRGGSIDRVFHIDPAGAGKFTVSFYRVAIIKGGVGGFGGGILNGDDYLNITRCILSENQAGGLVAGGAISNGSGELRIVRSTFSGNWSDNGGGVYNAGELSIVNSTFSGNGAAYGGGALYNGGGPANLSSVTITGNRADDDGNGSGNGGGIYVSAGELRLKNSIVAGNIDETPGPGDIHPDLSGDIDGNARNLIGDTTGCTGTAGSGSDIVGADPGLGPLQDNGGDTPTHAIHLHSPAYNAVVDCTDTGGHPLTMDQRGVVRPQSLACDIGAYELAPVVIYLPIVLREWEP